ncbi:HAD family hydrolase [Streptomyces sp. H27-D2]|uniref:HAD family hydrolase n=1 Tax=Streptomyces sp. H27-D2 TaxID=3046304 RepID=UPI002DB5CC16|nr:HAD family hydrolase [Streptomyces sp. H27-D2]MEC4018837.1 HAD family hydrolase [Streptomyces sp. H27-D2]
MTQTSARKLTCRMLLALAGAAAMTVPAAATTASAAEAAPRRGCVVVYFDLGETLVHTADDNSVRYVPRAAEHLRALRARHIPVGLITNVPSAWGATDAARAAELKKVIGKDWKGSGPFAWADFGDRIFTPRTEAERKPAPALWDRARQAAGRCRVVYEAETTGEVRTARSLGYVAYQVNRPSWPAYMPVPLIAALAHIPHR